MKRGFYKCQMLDFDNKKNYKNFLYITPFIIILTIFTFVPLIKTFIISFNGSYNKFSDSLDWTSFNFKNYEAVFKDPFFNLSFFNTIFLVFISVPISIFLSLMIALCLNTVYNKFLKSVLETFFFLPFLMNKVIMGIVFSIIFYHSYGFFNQSDGLMNVFLNKFFNIKSSSWVNYSASWGKKIFVLIVYLVWSGLPFKIFIFSLGLKNIDKNYYDAAKIDGASKFKILRKITIPLLSNVIFYQFILSILQVIKEYDSIIGVFGDISDNSNIQTITFYIYRQLQSNQLDSYAKGTAASMILFLISFIFVSIIFYFIKSKTIKKFDI